MGNLLIIMPATSSGQDDVIKIAALKLKIPEPVTIALFGAGLGGFFGFRAAPPPAQQGQAAIAPQGTYRSIPFPMAVPASAWPPTGKH